MKLGNKTGNLSNPNPDTGELRKQQTLWENIQQSSWSAIAQHLPLWDHLVWLLQLQWLTVRLKKAWGPTFLSAWSWHCDKKQRQWNAAGMGQYQSLCTVLNRSAPGSEGKYSLMLHHSRMLRLRRYALMADCTHLCPAADSVPGLPLSRNF